MVKSNKNGPKVMKKTHKNEALEALERSRAVSTSVRKKPLPQPPTTQENDAKSFLHQRRRTFSSSEPKLVPDAEYAFDYRVMQNATGWNEFVVGTFVLKHC